jgi:hypothetical protein
MDMREVHYWLRGSTSYDLEASARKAFEAYCYDADWKAVTGERIPGWNDCSDAVRAHWRAAVAAVVGNKRARNVPTGQTG